MTTQYRVVHVFDVPFLSNIQANIKGDVADSPDGAFIKYLKKHSEGLTRRKEYQTLIKGIEDIDDRVERAMYAKKLVEDQPNLKFEMIKN